MSFKKGHKINVGRIKSKKKFCIWGHEISVVGRNKQGMCHECRKNFTDNWHKNNPEKSKESRKKSGRKQYEKNKESRKNQSKRWRETNPDKALIIARNSTWKKNGIVNSDGTFFTTVDFDRVNNEQQSKCKICGRHQSNLKVVLNADHDHETGLFRGLICSWCNTIVGVVESKNFEQAIDYLNQFKND